MTKMAARRIGSDFEIVADGFVIGRLADCEVTFVFVSDDEQLMAEVGSRIEGDMSVREMLRAVRAGYEAHVAEMQAEQAAEIAAENAWARYAELPTMDDLGFEEWERARGCE